MHGQAYQPGGRRSHCSPHGHIVLFPGTRVCMLLCVYKCVLLSNCSPHGFLTLFRGACMHAPTSVYVCMAQSYGCLDFCFDAHVCVYVCYMCMCVCASSFSHIHVCTRAMFAMYVCICMRVYSEFLTLCISVRSFFQARVHVYSNKYVQHMMYVCLNKYVQHDVFMFTCVCTT